MSALDQTVLNTAIPKISIVLDDVNRAPWIITSYLLFATFATPVAGKLADIFGVKPMLTVSSLMFAATSALCGVSGFINLPGFSGAAGVTFGAMDQLIVFRGLQGIAGGAMMALCFVAIGDLMPSRDRGKFQGVLAADFMIAAIVGPMLGGWLTDKVDWRWIFYLNIPVGVLAALIFVLLYPESTREKAKPEIDWPGIGLFILAVAPLLLLSNEIGTQGQFTMNSAMEIIVSISSMRLFIAREKSAEEPLIPLALFENRIVSISLVTVFITGIGFFGSMLLMAMVLQQVYKLTATMSGAVLAPLMLVVASASIVGGLLISKTGKYRALIILSLVLMTLGTLILSTVSPDAPMWVVPCSGVVGGIGLGLMLPVHSIIIQNAVQGSSMGIATSLSSLFRSLGGTIGTGMMGALLVWLQHNGHEHSQLPIALMLYAGSLVLAIVLNIFLPEIELKSSSQKATENA
ncbi:MFS transporter [Candidatus Obscuribacterales bacterium]|nr:MFS transporter [Candidatus Obscuribacterales bacterium]